MRALSEAFLSDLQPGGKLNPLLVQVKKDHTLMLTIRDGYINIYYRGGNILKVIEQSAGYYQTFFDERYNITEQLLADSHADIAIQADVKRLVTLFPGRKNMMDVYFSTYGKAEREYQQLVARENNYSPISNESEYFISDIEVTVPGARFDIMAIRWLASQRKSGSNCRVALIEMKYGDGALGGNAGLLKHLHDMDTLIANENGYANLLLTMEKQFNQLDQLGLLNFNKGSSAATVRLDARERPEVIFIFANHNPRSPKLKAILDTPEIAAYSQSSRFDLKFYVASFSGYGLHALCMLPLEEFRKLLGSHLPKS